MNAFHLEKSRLGNLHAIFIGQLRELYDAEQHLMRERYMIVLTVFLMVISAGAVYLIEQGKVKNFEARYLSQMDTREKADQSLSADLQTAQNDLKEKNDEMGEALDYINLLQKTLTEVAAERDAAYGRDSRSLQSRLGLTPYVEDLKLRSAQN